MKFSLPLRSSLVGVVVIVFFLHLVVDAFQSPRYCRIRGYRQLSSKAESEEAVEITASKQARKKLAAAKFKPSSPNSKNGNNRRSNSAKGQSIQAGRRRLNQQIVQCETPQELLQLLQTMLTKPAAGGALNTVNFSTALHRLARHCASGHTPSERAAVLSDPRFALFLACLGEALCLQQQSSDEKKEEDKTFLFRSREISNMGWALAKLKLPPPTSVMAPVENLHEALQEKSNEVRQAVLQVAMQRKNGLETKPLWIPPLSQLAGYILDHVGGIALDCINNNIRLFQMQEYANLLWAWATADRANPIVFSAVVNQMIRQQPLQDAESLRPQEWSNSIWAFATAGLYQDLQLLEFVAKVLEQFPEFGDTFKPQEWSNTAWGVATLTSMSYKRNEDNAMTREQELAALSIIRSAAKYVTTHCRTGNFKTQELSNTAWAMATLGFGLSAGLADSNNNYVCLASDQPEEDSVLMNAALSEILRSSLPLLPKFRSQELNNLAWALARLVDKQSISSDFLDLLNQVLGGMAQQLAHAKRPVSSQDIGTTVWALATLEFVHEKETLYRGIASRLVPSKAHTYKPQELSNTVWAMATAEIQINSDDLDAFDTSLISERPPIRDPAMIVFAIAARELMRRPYEFKAQEIKDVLWSYSKVGIRHPALFKAVTKHLIGDADDVEPARGLEDFSPQGLGNMAWAFARQAQLGAIVIERLKGSSNLVNTNGRLAVYTTSYIDIGEVPLQRFFAAIAETDLRVHKQLKKCKPQDLANTAWAFAVLGLKDVAFMEAVKTELLDRTQRFIRGDVTAMTRFKGQELANICWALATLNLPPGDVLQDLAKYICMSCKVTKEALPAAKIATMFKRQELANMAWACAVFEEYPTELMAMLYRGLVGYGKEQSPAYMASIHGDQGLQSQAIMTLIYVQAVRDLSDWSDKKISLPKDFPDGWKQSTPSLTSDVMTETSFDELNLSTSKMQRAVSDAFARIGFELVQEHVITMEEMARDYDISLAPKPVEILSIDIANVAEKIAIEVDGPAHFISRIDQTTAGAVGGYAKLINGKLEYQFAWDGSQQEINGPTALKERLLTSLGWRVIHIPFWEWYRVGNNEAAEEEYCRRQLSQ